MKTCEYGTCNDRARYVISTYAKPTGNLDIVLTCAFHFLEAENLYKAAGYVVATKRLQTI